MFFKQAHSLDPTNAKVLSNQAACLIAFKRVDEALAYACLCIKSDPKWSKGYYRKARAHGLLNEFELEYINAIKCAFYEPEFYQELHGVFKSNKLAIQDFCIVKNSISVSEDSVDSDFEEENENLQRDTWATKPVLKLKRAAKRKAKDGVGFYQLPKNV